MRNIWEWLLQTASVSLVALILLAVKELMRDQLSPRWQYGVWSILALRILFPVNVSRGLIPQLPLWLEAHKSQVEAKWDSAYTAPYDPLSLRHILPIPAGAPRSVTDWMFVFFTAGAVLCLLWYVLSYLRLRLRLRRGRRVSAAVQDQIDAVCATYGLKSCRAVEVKGLPSAFVCGVCRPVLVLPADRHIDDKILLHELLHLKHRDAWASMLWCVLRCLHWYNPLLHIVINRIENDMESLCDQRVLERLEGEERRAYGMILLDMANDRYPRAPGTTSVSNGGKNIARRIAAIVRFQKYPRGMALLSVCIVLSLLVPMLIGFAPAADSEAYHPDHGELAQAMAHTRLRRCSTVAGAIDTYAKGLLLGNGIYIATASPLARQHTLSEAMRQNEDNYLMAWVLDVGRELANVDRSAGYELYEVTAQEDGSYTAYLVFAVNGVDDDLLDISQYADEREVVFGCTVIVPIRVYREQGSFVVEERGARTVLAVRPDQSKYIYDEALPFRRQLRAVTEHGTLEMSYRTCFVVDNHVQTASGTLAVMFGTQFDTTPKPDATFETVHVSYFMQYVCTPDAQGRMPQQHVSILTAELDTPDQIRDDFPDIDPTQHVQGSSTGGYAWMNRPVTEGWDGTLWHGSSSTYYEIDEKELSFPAAFRVRILWDGEIVQDTVLKEVAS